MGMNVGYLRIYTCTKSVDSPWLIPEIFREIHDKQRAKVRAERTRDPCDSELYQTLKIG